MESFSKANGDAKRSLNDSVEQISTNLKATVVTSTGEITKRTFLSMESLIEQAGVEEIICVLDGVSDSVDEFVDAYLSEVRFISVQHPSGLAACMNIAIESSVSDYIARMDLDDICLADRISSQLRFLSQNPNVDVCGTMAVAEDGFTAGKVLDRPLVHDELRAVIHRVSPFIHPTVVGKREYFITNKYDERFQRAQDWELFSRTVDQWTFANLPILGVRYRIGAGVTFRKLRFKIWAGVLAAYRMKRPSGVVLVFFESFVLALGLVKRRVLNWFY